MSDTKRTKAIKALVITITMLALMALTYCNLLWVPKQREWPAVEGQVLEKDSQTPIENALVVALYEGSGVHGTQCFNTQMARTNKKGKYRITAWRNDGNSASLSNQYVYLHFYAVGFDRTSTIVYPGYSGETIYMEELSGSREELLGQLEWLARRVGCHTGSIGAATRMEAIRTELRILEILYGEAKSFKSFGQRLSETEKGKIVSIEYYLARKEVLLEFVKQGQEQYDSDRFNRRVNEILTDKFKWKR